MVIKIFKCIKPAKITNKLKNIKTNFKKHFYVALKPIYYKLKSTIGFRYFQKLFENSKKNSK